MHGEPLESAARVAALLRSARSIVVSSQSPLDGDSVGCEVALLELGPELAPGARWHALNESAVPTLYTFLDGTDRLTVLTPDAAPPEADLLILLDCGALDRFAFLPERFPATRILNLDHHASNTRFGDFHWVAPDHASTGEQVFEIARAAGAGLTPAAARGLYLALAFDTGRFAYSSTRPETLRYAADLVEAGARPEDLFRALWRNRTEGALRMMAFAVQHLNRGAAGRLAWVAVSAADLAAAGATREDLEDLVNLPLTLAGVEVSLLLRELTDGRTKVSLRSDRWFDVAAFAAHFGGGGHVRAAGAVVDLALEAAAAALVPALDAAVRKVS
ncbi:MAG: bifunctional oligoribonuclease/PAP phosphatase NrnA [Planctomycetes bacterium]|nr:bifunctional oligoribonuclease/PAP phosphatase NrnA [Planctomycetota bacterium]